MLCGTAFSCGRYNEIHGITPSVAKAAAVGDSLLDCISAARDNKNVYSKRDAVGQEDGVNGLASWTDASLPPDQVIILPSLVRVRFVVLLP